MIVYDLLLLTFFIRRVSKNVAPYEYIVYSIFLYCKQFNMIILYNINPRLVSKKNATNGGFNSE